jgi:hypothetical protein
MDGERTGRWMAGALSHGLPGYSAEERARTISRKIAAIAADRSVSTESLRIVRLEDRTRIMAGEATVLRFADSDAAAAGVSREFLADRALEKIKPAIDSYRNDRRPHVLLINTGYAGGATVLLVILLFAIRSGFRKLNALAEQRLKARMEALETQSRRFVRAQQLRKVSPVAQRVDVVEEKWWLRYFILFSVFILGFGHWWHSYLHTSWSVSAIGKDPSSSRPAFVLILVIDAQCPAARPILRGD